MDNVILSAEDRGEEVKKFLIEKFGKITNFDRFRCQYENVPFYDVAIFQIEKQEPLIVKWHEPRKAKKIEIDFYVGEYLFSKGILVPQPKKLFLEFPLIVMEYLPGKIIMENVENWQVEEMAKILAKLHSFFENEQGTEFIPKVITGTFQEEIVAKFDSNIHTIEKNLDVDYLERIITIFNKLLKRCSRISTRGLCHRDVHYGNWQVHQNGKIYLLDHAQAEFGDIAYDINKIRKTLQSRELLEVFRLAYDESKFDAANDYEVQILIDLLDALGILVFLNNYFVKQKKYEAYAYEQINKIITNMTT